MKAIIYVVLTFTLLLVSCSDSKKSEVMDPAQVVETADLKVAESNESGILQGILEDYFINKTLSLKEITTPFYFDFISESVALSANPEPNAELDFTKKYNDAYNVSQTGYPEYFLLPDSDCNGLDFEVIPLGRDDADIKDFRVTIKCKENNKSYSYKIEAKKTADTFKIDAVTEL